MFDLTEHSHTRLNILTGEWILVSPHRMKRPWQGKVEAVPADNRPAYDAGCYLCPGNKRIDGTVNPAYTGPYSFVNDFSALLAHTPSGIYDEKGLLSARSESGICKVICFSPRHDLTLPQMSVEAIEEVVALWKNEFETLAAEPSIKYIQIFENKGEIMGCSNPHPHGQIWSSSSVPLEPHKETVQQAAYYEKNGVSLLSDYLSVELKQQERIVAENDDFVVLVPFWAVWPYETMVVSKRHIQTIAYFTQAEMKSLSSILKELTIKYDNLFQCSFPYSSGIHQAPVNDGEHSGWHWHMHFYPPLLRSASVKKFMVGYEMLANPQRDITPETAAATLRNLEAVHYSEKQTHD
jgi:UDPglucose--hexose-1-phosphate uridylyltransferase